MLRGKLQYLVCTVDYLVTVALYTITHTMYAPPKLQATGTIIFNDARDMSHAYSCYILVKYFGRVVTHFPMLQNSQTTVPIKEQAYII